MLRRPRSVCVAVSWHAARECCGRRRRAPNARRCALGFRVARNRERWRRLVVLGFERNDHGCYGSTIACRREGELLPTRSIEMNQTLPRVAHTGAFAHRTREA